jgi:ATP-dependent Clp protease ATP-binding subunit ClpX
MWKSMSKPINPEKLQEELSEYVRSKYGSDVPVPDMDLGAPHDGVPTSKDVSAETIDFDLKPTELEAFLRKYVVHQDRAIEILATKICTHFHRRKYESTRPRDEMDLGHIKSNILMIGPTGVGKTYIIKLIAKRIGVPFVKGDATKFSETGYVGGDVEDLVRELVREANGNIKLAEYGIIYVDEIDKIASSGSAWGPDVSRSGVQRALLKLMEDTDVDLRVPHDLAAQMEAVMETQRTGKADRKKVNTQNILFVVSGAFSGLPEIVRKRLSRGSMGFGNEPVSGRSAEALIKRASTSDLVDYGFESEFVGRLPVIAQLNELDADALYDILKNPNSAVIQGKQRDFASYGIKLDFTDDALREIAERAHHAGIGARGLLTVTEGVLMRFEKLLPSSTIKELTVTKEMVEEPQKKVAELFFEQSFLDFQRKFLESSGVTLEFPEESRDWLQEQTEGDPEKTIKFLSDALHNYEYGLKLAGKTSLKITPELLRDPEGYLDTMVKQAYAAKEKGTKKNSGK